jgi:two-component system, NarL family, nitrate/nitrite response regulator NarL
MRVAIVTHIRLYGEGLADALRRRGIDVVATAADKEAALDGVARGRPDVALVDVAAPDGIATVHALASEEPSVKVIALGVTETERDVIACAEAGAASYVSRDGSLESLGQTLRRTVDGELHCSPRITAVLLRRVAELAPQPAGVSVRLTAREREVVALIHNGLSNREIAAQLCVELSTVKNHVHNILEKLGVGRRTQAAALVAEQRR